MPNHSIVMNKLRQVFYLSKAGYGSRSIANTLGMSRTTVRKYLEIYHRSKLSMDALLSKSDGELCDLFGLAPTSSVYPRLEKLSPLLPDYAKRLKKRGMTRKILYQEYKDKYPDGYSYCRFNRFLRAYMDQGKTMMHIEHKAGEKMYVDFCRR